VSSLAFLSPSRCEPGTLASPLARALDTVAGTASHRLRDLSLDGKIEVRGDLDRLKPPSGEELVRLSPGRGLLLTADDPAVAVERLRAAGALAYDASGALAGLEIEGEQLMRRLTDLDLDRLPAAGPFAHVTAVVLRDEGERFRVYVPQELGHYVAEAVLDAIEGLSEPHTGAWLEPGTTSGGTGA
jgi:hypothetical protein